MRIRSFVICAAAASTALLFSSSQADELIYSGFMTDYTQLEKVSDGSADYRYVVPGGEDKMAKYNAVMIDQPEIFIANDSSYRGAKPKHLEAFAESIRTGISSALVVGGVKGAATSDLAKKANLQGLVFELEGFDSVSGERIIAIIDSIGSDVQNPATWEELEVFMATYGRLLQCRFDNASLPAEQRVNCLAQQ